MFRLANGQEAHTAGKVQTWEPSFSLSTLLPLAPIPTSGPYLPGPAWAALAVEVLEVILNLHFPESLLSLYHGQSSVLSVAGRRRKTGPTGPGPLQL